MVKGDGDNVTICSCHVTQTHVIVAMQSGEVVVAVVMAVVLVGDCTLPVVQYAYLQLG